MDSRPITGRVSPGAVESAALTRIAELETQLAQERTESARRLREVEPRIQQFRTAIQSMNQQLKRAAEERSVLDARLAGEIDETERLTRRIAEIEAEAAAASAPIEADAQRVGALERKLGAAQERVTGLREALVDAKRSGAQPVAGTEAPVADDGHPDVIGLRIDGAPRELALGRRYEAHDTDSRRDVEILVFAQALPKLNGARLDALLLARHHNLASAVAFGRTRARPYVVFERATGETLEQWVRRAGPASEPAALRVGLQIARGLREASFHGALHGDLSPRVVRITPAGDVKVEDTGVGELHPPSSRPLPSPEFAAPERLHDGAPPDARADIFSLGALLHFVLTGHAPFEVNAPRPSGQGPDPRRRRPTVSAETAELVATMTAHAASARPATWDEVLAAIERLVAGGGAAPAPAPRPVASFLAAHPYVAAAVAAAPLVAAALWLRFGPGFGPSARARFDAAARQADALAARGDPVGAAFTLGRYLKDTGDPVVEQEAFDRLAKLRRR